GKIYTNKELYLKAIQLNPKNAILYYNIACLLENNETVELLNGKIYTSKELYLKAIQLNPKNAMFYCNFANLLKNHETIKLLNGEIYTNKKLYLKSTQLDPKNAIVYSNLAYLLKNNETIKLLNGEIYTKKELYLKAAQLDPKNAILCFNLACLLENDETVKFLNGKIYTKKELYLKAIQLDPKNAQSYAKLAYILQDDETIKLLSGKIYTKKGLYLKAIELDPKNAMLYYNLTYLLKNKEKVKLLSGEIYTKKELYLKVVDLQSIESLDPQAQRYLQQIYAQEIEKNPNNIEGYFGLISIIQNNTVSLKNKKKADIEFLFKEALHLDPTFAFSPRFAPHFFSVASHFFHKTTALLQELSTSFAIEDEFLRAKLLKEGASLTLKNGEVISTKALYQHALPFLSSAYLKRKGNEGVGDYLSLRKYTVLQDGIKLTKLQAYTYVYQNNPAQYILTKIGDALHPEERILLRGKFYDKRTCYEEAKSDDSDAIALLKWTESLYPHEQLRKKELFHHVLKKVHQCYKARLEPYTVLARILSQFELTGSDSKDLCIFEKSLKEWSLTKNKKSIRFVSRRYGNSDDLDISDELYFTKKREFLLELLKYRPSCEEAYVALATSFQNPLSIHEKSYTSKEALYLKAIDINPEYSLPRFLLGKELFNQNIENIQLLNGMILSCKQLFMRAIQLGTYEAEAYHLAALMMDDREGILLFDEKTILSRGDLFVRAFELDFTRIMDLINFISYAKRRKSFHLNVDY
ncbi:MAG: tetratricopeptide repeat protein, partial [Candidatus Rhabdochlamydia sp.]